MAIRPQPCLKVYLVSDPGGFLAVRLDHYDTLKDHLDKKDTGWIELNSTYGEGKVFVDLEDIELLAFCPQSHCDAAYAEALENESKSILD